MGFSCETQLISLVEDISHAMDDGFQTDLILLDFSKAFDTDPHQHLLNKLEHYKIDNLIMTWIKSWLTQSTQFVVVNILLSISVCLIRCVSRYCFRSFNVFNYINDIANEVSSSICLFADECILYRVIKSENDSVILQHDLNLLSQLVTVWQMKFNVNKCVVLCTNQVLPVT